MITTEIPYITDQFRNIVSKVSAKLTPELSAFDSEITGVNYMHGHYREIIENLKQNDASPDIEDKNSSYPLVCLIEDIKFKDVKKPGFFGLVNPTILIAYRTERNYKADERYQKIFKPILDPIYVELCKQVDKSGYYHIQNWRQIQVPMSRHLFYGRYGLAGVDGNIFNDQVDCIEWSPSFLMYPPDQCQSIS